VVAGLGGNTASQNVAMIVRSLALGKITSKLIWRIMGRQILVGFLQGLAVGLVTGIAVTIWIGNIYLGIILGLALIGNMIIAGIIGTAVPLGLNALGQDPALASSVFVTAFTDAFGFFIFLTLAAVTYNFLT
jgi:magnesium transporter